MLQQHVASHRELLEEQTKVELEIQQAAAIEHSEMLTEKHEKTLAQLDALRSYLEQHVTSMNSEICAGEGEGDGDTSARGRVLRSGRTMEPGSLPVEPEPEDGTVQVSKPGSSPMEIEPQDGTLPAPPSSPLSASAAEGCPPPEMDQEDAAHEEVLEPEIAELKARLDAFARNLSRFVANKAHEAQAAHSREDRLRDALKAQLEAHALEIEAQRRVHQAEVVAASEKHTEQLAAHEHAHTSTLTKHIDEHESKLQLHTEEATEASKEAARKEASLRSEHSSEFTEQQREHSAHVVELAAKHEELIKEHADQMQHHVRTAEEEKASLEDQMRQAQARIAEEHEQHLELKDMAHRGALSLWHQKADALGVEMVEMQRAANLEQERLCEEMAALRIEHAEALRMQQQAAQAERDMLAGNLMHEKALLRTEYEKDIMAREATAAVQVSAFGQSEDCCCGGSVTERVRVRARVLCCLAEGKDGGSRKRVARVFRWLGS